MSAVYFWDGLNAITYGGLLCSDDEVVPHLDMFCIDAFCDNPEERYGVFSRDTEGGVQWYYVPYALFPPQFKAWLLINN